MHLRPEGRACRLWAALAIVALAGCSSAGRKAPVEDRSTAAKPPAVAATSATEPAPKPLPGAENAGKPGYYTVKPGDTLVRIALDNGQNWRDVARWNNLDNPNLVEVGQVLRVVPPPADPAVAAATARAVAAAGRVDTRPLDGRPAGVAGPIASAPPAGTAAPVATAPVAVPSSTTPPTPPATPPTTPPPTTPPTTPPNTPPNTLPNTLPNTPPNTPPPAPAVAPAVAPDTPAAPRDPAEDVSWIWPAAGAVAAGFDEGRNKGLTIVGRAGDPVLAAGDGRVVYAGSSLRGYGNLVIVKHNELYLTAYAHNQVLLVKDDQVVRRGQKIAEMGSTDAERVQLHFEIRRQGKPIDPARLLPPR